MKKFIVIYHASEDSAQKMASASPEEMKKGMEPWMEWAKKCGSGLVDMGTPLANGQKVTKKGTSLSDKDVVGYSVLQANSMEEAVKMLKEHPHLDWTDGCEIEVHESMSLPGM
ncbi:MAG: hypothetical protein A3B86_03165 [Candidatus Yanofskybacteria bacterium RIFCSPHIGHO2_02_FULL_38_22b]|uniref:YCII-related domain-containing protein n=1 Tax=Candidatus Yanofskybacteria bacterium RIFCSPHIGHO2_02_FULL_38_22b TaxID=1802673 RepID=A0A1F8F3G1_9BACT|nr:MAG: hypothetical protein A2816_03385 [Candidatus Yanofskybacteria bacterium RIFCSPHIGHO2_01_FULL_39_44]OGN07208.1 MAG: hypothetical protein A3B86_03165 [Candidatus Yanofskybacteria bacterium RIFCSPHIGHO2_02_FULL_38_22b]OGN20087.1 MAG: hypothetical protein A2910_01125 [Candidatus Yanofskybacteria bacterium RIFCSPLOWO2_01_FULL_39_28]